MCWPCSLGAGLLPAPSSLWCAHGNQPFDPVHDVPEEERYLHGNDAMLITIDTQKVQVCINWSTSINSLLVECRTLDGEPERSAYVCACRACKEQLHSHDYPRLGSRLT